MSWAGMVVPTYWTKMSVGSWHPADDLCRSANMVRLYERTAVKRGRWRLGSLTSFFLFPFRVHSFVRSEEPILPPRPCVRWQRGAQDRSTTGAFCARPKGLVIDRSSTALCLETSGHGRSWREARYSEPGGIFGRSCYEVHGACDNRIKVRYRLVPHVW